MITQLGPQGAEESTYVFHSTNLGLVLVMYQSVLQSSIFIPLSHQPQGQ